MNTKPIIGIAPNYSYEKKEYTLSEDYVLAIEKAGGCPIVLLPHQALPPFLDGLLLTWIMGVYFPEEATAIALLTSLPWFLAGFFAYLCTAYALLEPQRRTKLMGAILGVGLCAPLLLTAPPGALAPAVPWFAALLPILLLGLLHPAMNFRHRRTS